MSLFRPLNEDILEEGKRVSYKKYMRNGAAAYGSLGALGGGLAGAGLSGVYGPGAAVGGAVGGSINGAIGGALTGAGAAFARNHSKKIDNFVKYGSFKGKKSKLDQLREKFKK